MDKEKIPEGTLETNDYQEYVFECKGVMNYNSLVTAKELLSSMLDEEKSILRKVNVLHSGGNLILSVKVNSSAVTKIQEEELLGKIQDFVKEFVSLPSIYLDSYKYDYKKNLKSLKYFFDQYELIDGGEKKTFKDVLIKRKMI